MLITCYSAPRITSSVQYEQCNECGSDNVTGDNYETLQCADCGSKDVVCGVMYTGAVGLRCVDCDGDAGTAMIHDLPEGPCPKCGGKRIQLAPTDEDKFPYYESDAGERRAEYRCVRCNTWHPELPPRTKNDSPDWTPPNPDWTASKCPACGVQGAGFVRWSLPPAVTPEADEPVPF